MSRRSLVCLAVGLSGCSWARFDELTTDAPVVVLERPSEIRSGFGTAMSSVTGEDDRALLLVHGATGFAQAALFDLGAADSPLTSTLSDGFCSNDSGVCFLASSSAPLQRARGPSTDHENCFAIGIGRKQNRTGVLIECESREGFAIEVPPEFEAQIQTAIDQGKPEFVALASGSGETQALVAGSEKRSRAFYYPNIGASPVDLSPTRQVMEGYGATVAIATVEDAGLVVVGAPAQDAIHLFAVQPQLEPVSAPSYLGCVRGPAGFGRAFAVGPVTPDDALPELAVADSANVHVFEARTLLTLAAGDESDCVAIDGLPAGALYASVTCSETGAVTGCGGADFGASVAIGDVDGDGDGELVVGAPGMSARDASAAGAIAFFDLEDSADDRTTDLKFIASASDSDRLGASLVAARVASRHVIAAGVPGSGRTALFYCPSLLPARLGGARCD
jgi:hypothetical protein